jgi:flagellar P-ring protein precursor FlgI
VQINHLSAGRIPEGATVERAVATPMSQGDSIQLDLNSSDYATAREVVRAINARMGPGTADAIDGRAIRVRMPESADARVSFLAEIQNLDVRPPLPAAKVVINARTGSVVMNQAVTLAACAVAHGSLSVTISTTPAVSQPGRSRARARPRSPRRPTSRSPSKPARWCRWRRAPSSPTSSRP